MQQLLEGFRCLSLEVSDEIHRILSLVTSIAAEDRRTALEAGCHVVAAGRLADSVFQLEALHRISARLTQAEVADLQTVVDPVLIAIDDVLGVVSLGLGATLQEIEELTLRSLEGACDNLALVLHDLSTTLGRLFVHRQASSLWQESTDGVDLPDLSIPLPELHPGPPLHVDERCIVTLATLPGAVPMVVAIKEPQSQGLVGQKEALAQQRRALAGEARACARVCHPHVQRVYGVVANPGGLIMEPWESSLWREMSSGQAPTAGTLRLLRDWACGLVAIHAKKLLHNNVNPETLLITSTSEGIRVGQMGHLLQTSPTSFQGAQYTAAVPWGHSPDVPWRAPELLQQQAELIRDLYPGASEHQLLRVWWNREDHGNWGSGQQEPVLLLGEAADVYGFGLVLLAALLWEVGAIPGMRPRNLIPGHSSAEDDLSTLIMVEALQGNISNLQDYVPDHGGLLDTLSSPAVTQGLSALTRHCLNPEPLQRPSSRQLLAELEQLCRAEQVAADLGLLGPAAGGEEE